MLVMKYYLIFKAHKQVNTKNEIQSSDIRFLLSHIAMEDSAQNDD